MGDLTLQKMRDEVKNNLGNRTDLPDDRVDRYLNMAQLRIARSYHWGELDRRYEATLPYTGDAEQDKQLSFPDDVRDVYSFRVLIDGGLSRKLERRSPREFDEAIPEPEYYARNKPLIYTLWDNGRSIEMYPVPDDDYEAIIRTAIWPHTLAENDDLSQLDRKDDMLIHLATSMLFESYGRSEESTKWYRIYRTMHDESIQENAEKPDLEIKAPVNEHSRSRRGGEYWRDPFNKSGVK